MPFRPTHHIRSAIILLCGWQWRLLWLCAGLAFSAQATYSVSSISQAHQLWPSPDHIVHLPFGPVQSLEYGNGLSMSRSYDVDYRLTAETAETACSVFMQDYQYDLAGNLSVQSDDTGAAKQESYAYDALNRLAGTLGSNLSYQAQNYSYDAVGNRTELDVDSAHTGYQYDLASQKLISVDRNGSLTAYTTDQQGNIIEGRKAERIAVPPYGGNWIGGSPNGIRPTADDPIIGLGNFGFLQPGGHAFCAHADQSEFYATPFNAAAIIFRRLGDLEVSCPFGRCIVSARQ